MKKTTTVKTNPFKIAQCGIGKHHGLKHVQAYFALSTDIEKKKKKAKDYLKRFKLTDNPE